LALGEAQDIEREPESSGANSVSIIVDDETIDEEDEPTQAYFSSYIALRKNIMNTQHLFSGAASSKANDFIHRARGVFSISIVVTNQRVTIISINN
jgi:hypothetical protein